MAQSTPASGQDAPVRDFEPDAATIAAAPTPGPHTDEDEKDTPRTGSATETDAIVAPVDAKADETADAAAVAAPQDAPQDGAPPSQPPPSAADKLAKPQIILLMSALCVCVTDAVFLFFVLFTCSCAFLATHLRNAEN